jgi:hypothetical protein
MAMTNQFTASATAYNMVDDLRFIAIVPQQLCVKQGTVTRPTL